MEATNADTAYFLWRATSPVKLNTRLASILGSSDAVTHDRRISLSMAIIRRALIYAVPLMCVAAGRSMVSEE